MARSTFESKRTVTRFDLSDPTTLYIGYADYVGLYDAPTAPAESAAVWTIKKITMASGSPTKTEWTEAGAASWTNHTTEVYA